MSTPAPLLPQAFWFRVAAACERIDALPRKRGRLLDLPAQCRLPDLAELEGEPSWADVRTAWNPGGLGIAIEVSGLSTRSRDAAPPPGAGVQLWLDTRDTRDVHRATRFCHHFAVTFEERSPGGVKVAQKPIHRATADAPTAAADDIVAQAERLKGGWRVELFFNAQALHGFDPETNRRLGFAYQVRDGWREDQFFGVGAEFPIATDPSLWSTLELREPG